MGISKDAKRKGPQTTKPNTFCLTPQVVVLRLNKGHDWRLPGLQWADQRSYWARHYRGVGANHAR